MNTLPDHSAIQVLMTTQEIITIESPKRNAPSIHQAVKSIQQIVEMDLNSDWSIYHSMILSYLYGSGVQLEDSFNLDITSDFLNANKVDEGSVYELLENHTSTYKVTEDQLRDSKEDQDQKDAYYLGQS